MQICSKTKLKLKWQRDDVQAIQRIFCWWIQHNRRRQKELEGTLLNGRRRSLYSMGLARPYLQKVVGAGWDQVDINNYVLYYNSQVETTLAVRSPGLDMSMKQTINAIIRTKLQAGQEEREIGLVTPTTQKGPSTGEPSEPNPGMLPPGPRKRSVVSPKPSTSAQQRLKPKKPSAQSVKEAQAELKKNIGGRRGRKNERRQQLEWRRKAARKLPRVE